MAHRQPAHVALATLAALWAQGLAQSSADEAARVPTPPLQAAAWSPPATKLPKFLVSATQTLCDQGLADPRGCDYRVVEVKIGDVWGANGASARTHGWVMPRANDRQEDFAVCWNGLVYPAVKLGDRADLDADIRALARALEASRSNSGASIRQDAFGGLAGGYRAFPERISVTVERTLPIKVCLLLRLGRADLAESVFAAATVWKPEFTGRDLTDYGISYLTLASDWAWSLFERAVCAHMRGDDRIALADARMLVKARTKIEARAAEMGFQRRSSGMQNGTTGPYLEFLGQAGALRDDQERRAREKRRGDVPPRGADHARRIAALITALDQVAVRQLGQPGGVALRQDPIVQALIAEGEEAVEPLLVALETDTRLTRTVSFHRDFFRSRLIHGANEAAYWALCGILGITSFSENPSQDFVPNNLEGRNKVSGRIRAYWEQNKQISPVERWYGTLRDDTATPAQWQEAAANLVHPRDSRQPRRKPGEPAALEGDQLRTGREPSITELISRRILDLARPDRSSQPGGAFPLLSACHLAFLLDRWDPQAAVPIHKTVMARCFDEFAGKKSGRAGTPRQSLLNTLPVLAAARASAGDLEGLDQAAEVVRQLTELDVVSLSTEWPRLMASYPQHPALQAAVTWLFNDPKSPWLAELRRTHFQLLGYSRYLTPPMFGVPGFRERVEILLDDVTVLGTVRIHEGKNIRNVVITWSDQEPGTTAAATLDPSAPKPGPELPFRVCDYVASCFALHRLAGITEFQLDWPQPRRDQALEKCREFLKGAGR